MAGFQSASFMVSDHPVLYGTTLAISLVGSVAALSPGGTAVPIARVGYALGLTENALAAVTVSPINNAAKPAAVGDSVDIGQVELSVVNAPEGIPVIPIERHSSTMLIGLEASPHRVVPQLAMTGLATRPQQELKAVPQAISAPALAALQESQRDTPVAAPAGADVNAQPSQSFVAVFQAIPTPALAAPAERQGKVLNDGSAGSDASTLTTTAVMPGQAVTAFASVPVEPQSKLVELPAAQPAIVPALPRAPETVVSRDQVGSKLTAASGTLPAATSLQPAAAKPAPAAQPLRLINSPQLRKFDLARLHVPAGTSTAALARPVAKPVQAGKIRTTGAKDKLVGDVVFHRVTVTVAGSTAKPLDVRIGADMKPSIRVGDLLGLVSDRMDPVSANRFATAASADEYVSLAALRASGFNVSYNAGTDSISISAAD